MSYSYSREVRVRGNWVAVHIGTNMMSQPEHYTPEQARELARVILRRAEEAEENRT